jgi:hypothetical protein
MRALSSAAIMLMIGVVNADWLAAQTTAGATVSATFQTRSSLAESSPTLTFEVTDPDRPAIASIDFVAAARAPAGAEVRLIVEAAASVTGPGGPGVARLALDGGSEGVVIADLPPSVQQTAARWTGSGRRAGRLVFALQASAPGRYSVPLRLAVSVP